MEQLYRQWIQEKFHGRARDFEEVIRKQIAVTKIRATVLAGVPESEQDTQWSQWLRNLIGSAQIKEFTEKEKSNAD